MANISDDQTIDDYDVLVDRIEKAVKVEGFDPAAKEILMTLALGFALDVSPTGREALAALVGR